MTPAPPPMNVLEAVRTDEALADGVDGSTQTGRRVRRHHRYAVDEISVRVAEVRLHAAEAENDW